MQALVTNIQGYSIHDGPGIRTVVFLKGCPLSCKWCANPECISPDARTVFIETLCKHCGRCAGVCPHGAINTDATAHRIDYSRCTGCGVCADECYYEALVRYGKQMSVGDVFDAVRRDKIFYGDGGGLTVSGGEPLLHIEFVEALFGLCEKDGISTCIETSGFAKAESLIRLLPLTDHVLFDLKLMNDSLHMEYTGYSNEIILQNAAIAAESGADILFRVPLIPGVNDDIDNTRETAEFVRRVCSDPKVQIMPYHRLGDSKYKALNMINALRELEVMPPDRLEEVRQAFVSFGVACSISA